MKTVFKRSVMPCLWLDSVSKYTHNKLENTSYTVAVSKYKEILLSGILDTIMPALSSPIVCCGTCKTECSKTSVWCTESWVAFY